MRKVAQIMGMPITIDIVGCHDEAVFGKTFDRLKQIDVKFSTYKPDSEVSRFREGKIKKNQVSNELNEVIKACKAWDKKTDGYFSAWYGGKFDPSGYVKGWAIAEAGGAIEKQGFKTYCIGAGGDVLANSDSGKVWKIGVQDPTDKTKILNRLSISSGAVATSGNYLRGLHIINPITGKSANHYLRLTVTGPDIITADVLATAAFAMGKKGIDFINKQIGYKFLAVTGEVVGNDI